MRELGDFLATDDLFVTSSVRKNRWPVWRSRIPFFGGQNAGLGSPAKERWRLVRDVGGPVQEGHHLIIRSILELRRPDLCQRDFQSWEKTRAKNYITRNGLDQVVFASHIRLIAKFVHLDLSARGITGAMTTYVGDAVAPNASAIRPEVSPHRQSVGKLCRAVRGSLTPHQGRFSP